MAKLKEADIKPALGQVSTQAAKNLILAGINGSEQFPTLLRDYTWTTAKPYDMALIIIAYYTYCRKSSNQSIKKFGKEATVKNSRSYKLFNYILEGNGSKIKSHLSDQYFTVCMINILEQIVPSNDAKILAPIIIKGMAKKAKDINLEKMPNGQKSFIQNLINKMRGESAPIPQEEKTLSTNQKLSDEVLNEKILPIIKWSSQPDEIQDMLEKYNIKLNEPYVNPKTHKKETLLFYAAREGAMASISVLLKQGADPCIYLDGYTPLICTLLNHNIFGFFTLIKDGRSINLPCKNADYIKQLSINQSSNTLPITLALFNHKSGDSALEELIKGGADLNNQDNPHKETPLHTFIRYRQGFPINVIENTVCLLLKNGANPNLKDKNGNTLLHLAAIYHSQNTSLTKALLKNGADPTITNNDGHLPMECTTEPEIVSLLAPPLPLLECPICNEEKPHEDFEFPFSCQPAKDYPNGHYVCNECANKLTRCPICGAH